MPSQLVKCAFGFRSFDNPNTKCVPLYHMWSWGQSSGALASGAPLCRGPWLSLGAKVPNTYGARLYCVVFTVKCVLCSVYCKVNNKHAQQIPLLSFISLTEFKSNS